MVRVDESLGDASRLIRAPLDRLAAAVSVSSAILNHHDMAGASIYDAASEALQYAALLNGDYVTDAVGDVVDRKQQAAS